MTSEREKQIRAGREMMRAEGAVEDARQVGVGEKKGEFSEALRVALEPCSPCPDVSVVPTTVEAVQARQREVRTLWNAVVAEREVLVANKMWFHPRRDKKAYGRFTAALEARILLVAELKAYRSKLAVQLQQLQKEAATRTRASGRRQVQESAEADAVEKRKRARAREAEEALGLEVVATWEALMDEVTATVAAPLPEGLGALEHRFEEAAALRRKVIQFYSTAVKKSRHPRVQRARRELQPVALVEQHMNALREAMAPLRQEQLRSLQEGTKEVPAGVKSSAKLRYRVTNTLFGLAEAAADLVRGVEGSEAVITRRLRDLDALIPGWYRPSENASSAAGDERA